MFKQYGGLALAIRTYWKDYGGWRDFVQSPILHVSIIFAFAAFAGWIAMDWRALIIGMMPTILGFSLAAYAITFSLMGSKLHVALARATDDTGKPLVISVNATFFHNVFIQAIALSFSVLSNGSLIAVLIQKILPSGNFRVNIIKAEIVIGSLVGPFLLCYAVLLLFSSGMAMFRLGRLTPSSSTAPTMVANDAAVPALEPTPARELYGIRWAIIRVVAKILRVNG